MNANVLTSMAHTFDCYRSHHLNNNNKTRRSCPRTLRLPLPRQMSSADSICRNYDPFPRSYVIFQPAGSFPSLFFSLYLFLRYLAMKSLVYYAVLSGVYG
jgi:hypothetical protein